MYLEMWWVKRIHGQLFDLGSLCGKIQIIITTGN
jgi:hypothetical protein